MMIPLIITAKVEFMEYQNICLLNVYPIPHRQLHN